MTFFHAAGTDTMERAAKHLNVSQFRKVGDFKFTKNSDGTGRIEGISVFRAGTFRDMMGTQHTWTLEHLHQMVFHFDLLRSQGIFVDVPWRVDHSQSANSVIGYIEKLYVDGTLLRADVTVTEPDAADKIDRGTFRSRSAEVGLYETNDESFYFPVLMGVAFVDIGAVEGLFSAEPRKFTPLSDPTLEGQSMFMIDGKQVTPEEWTAAVNYAKALADLGVAEQIATLTTERDAARTQAQAAIAAHAAARPVAFRINGTETADANAVQSHITQLEAFQADTQKVGRADFVKGLAAANKIGAPQVESLTALAHSLDAEQFEAFKKTWDVAPAQSLFALHTGGITNPDGTKGQVDPKAQKIADLEQTVAMHRRAGMTDKQIEQTGSFKELAALKSA